LALTALVVFLVEVFVFVPSLGAFHHQALRDRIDLGQTAALAVEAAPAGAELPAALREDLLVAAQVKRVALRRDDQRSLILSQDEATSPTAPIKTYRLDQMGPLAHMGAALDCLWAPPGRLLRVVATPSYALNSEIDVLVAEGPIKQAVVQHAWRTFLVSLLVSVGAAAVVYIALNYLFVRPMRRLTRDIERFRDRPEDESVSIKPSGRLDEIGRAETALAAMEQELRAALRHRERLAALGAAVAKIAHDLRNNLATASLVTDSLSGSDDPAVRRMAPRLERAVARAASLAEEALIYGRAQEPAPRIDKVPLQPALREALADAMAGFPGVQSAVDAPAELEVQADPDHLYRILTNLVRNAAQAMAEQTGRTAPGTVFVSTFRDGESVRILIADDGPGLPQKVLDTLFQPFVGTQRRGGTGLGLAIARELARAMGGDVTLSATGPQGTAFELRLPRGG
jgi:hypothetical protein